jgi:hypothetical protein
MRKNSMTTDESSHGNGHQLDIHERINALGFAFLIIGFIGAFATFLLILIGGPSSDSAGYHEGRVFALTETSGFLFFVALGMIAIGTILYFLTRHRKNQARQ